ncbi:MAG TPA: translation elongation factor 4 [Candidatus Saccharibacteria bacterium]|nr:translation elongation factor 4 [Candidatus Saccharibacteria bacterium]HRN90699.1 translation elongation factor 4 [Candidatus Saccharibacteria bacterium]HRN96887.1 translation elongation factor 4 [Candidatus Saccharibacteria bacterium]HRQ07230.1 translation elongation factor 4 [Candidatus Saccharibacteria bacterium]HRQ98280.1 translation elongation factor 4 [Candidatus Saccharibacteria bacterium]
MTQDHIRNFCIIAHIDHGKSTLADRMMEMTDTVSTREMKSQMLDSMDLEREKGITIKLAPVRMKYRDHDLNLIDTPGHVDFSYEVSRSLQACEGAVLVVDASQGIQAQTLANVYLAMAADLTIIPVLNKIDLPAADVPRVSSEIINLLGCSESDIIKISAKTGDGVTDVLDAVVERIAAPHGQPDAPTRALIFDSYYDDYRGVILYVRIVDGEVRKGDAIEMMATNASGIALEVGSLQPTMFSEPDLLAGEIGYIVTNLRTTRDARVGDTVTTKRAHTDSQLPGYKLVKPFVYAGFFPVSNDDYQNLKDAIEKLSLSDSALQFEPENSPVLGFGVRIGFLGLLHMDIIRERLEREYNLDLVVTNPSTDYQIKMVNGHDIDIKSASELPDVTKIVEIREPWIKGEIIVPKSYVGGVLQLIINKRGQQNNLSYIDERALISFEAPLANLLTDFYDQLKSVTSGYGSFNYELGMYRAEDLVRVDFYVAGNMVDALSVMAHRSEAQRLGREVVDKLKEVIPRQNFQVALQAAIGGKFIARADLSAYRKDVTTGLYGGDVSRKKKVLAKQAKGKKRMKRFGKVDIPSEAFTVMLKRD